MTRTFALPIYNRVFALESSDATQLKEERKKLQSTNLLRATPSLASIAFVAIGFA